MTSIITNNPVHVHDVLLGPLVCATEYNREYQSFSLTPRTAVIGATIEGIALGGHLSPKIITELRQALLDWKVLFFPQQDITSQQQKEFALLWGALESHPFVPFYHKNQNDPDIVTLDKDKTRGGHENHWHNDVTWREQPSHIAILKAVQIPAMGGDTIWCDMHSAYENLDDTTKREIESLYAYHDWIDAFGRIVPPDQIPHFRTQYPVVTHPVVRLIPENNHKVVFVNGLFTTGIVGYSLEESDKLLQKIYKQIYRPEYQVRFQWEENTVAMWDNRSCQHYAVSDYYPQPRKMQRVSVIGDKPIGIKPISA